MSDEDFFRANNRPEPATLPQLRYFRSLVSQRDISDMVKELPTAWLCLMNSLTKAIHNNTDQEVYESKAFAKTDLSKFIDRLKKCPPIAVCGPAGDPRTDVVQLSGGQKHLALTGDFAFGYNQYMPLPSVELQDGMYRNPNTGTIYKVYHTVHGNNIQVAKRLLIIGGEPGVTSCSNQKRSTTVKFKYEGRAPLKHLKPEYRLTIEQAREFGALYGTCCVCARTLTNELSIALGIGPVCGDREFGGEFQFLVDQAKENMTGHNPAEVTLASLRTDEERFHDRIEEQC